MECRWNENGAADMSCLVADYPQANGVGMRWSGEPQSGMQRIKRQKDVNLARTKYLLNRYPVFRAQIPQGLDLRISSAVLQILTFTLQERDVFTNRDCRLIDNCGPYLAPAMLETAGEIKRFPAEIAERIYPLLFHRYFDENGAAVSPEQLRKRLEPYGQKYGEDEIRKSLSAGEQMMAALLFANPFLTAMQACA